MVNNDDNINNINYNNNNNSNDLKNDNTSKSHNETSLNPNSLREEGEISSSSSSDDDENPGSSATHSAASADPLARISPSSSNKSTRGVQASKACSDNPTTSVDVQSRLSMQPNDDKSSVRNQLPLKSANPVWCAPPESNTNLVISFSDDETGSESEDCRPGKSSELKRNKDGRDFSDRPPLLLSAKSCKLQPTARNVNKVMSKKYFNRPSVSATTKTNGGPHSRVAVSTSIDQVAHVRNFNISNRNLSNPEHGSDQGQGLNNIKLRDLREQIALRERELKLKAVHQTKELASESGRDYNPVNQGADAARKANVTSVAVHKLEAKEPDKKRLKVSGLDGQQEIPSLKSAILLNEKKLRSNSFLDRNMADRGLKRSPPRRTESSIATRKKQIDKQMDTSEENPSSRLKEGATVNISHAENEGCSMHVEPCVLFDQARGPLTINSNVLLKNTNSVNLNPSVKSVGQPQPVSFSKKTDGENHLINSSEFHEGIPINRRGEASNHIRQASMDGQNPWNYFGAFNVSGRNKVDMNSLVEMEETLDKELEEAQEQRRICEVEERNALKAFRKAQRNLVEANSRCAELYRKRELYSAQFQTFFLNDSGLFGSTRKHVEIDLNHVDNASKSLELMLPSSLPDYEGRNQQGYNSNNQCTRKAPHSTPYMHASGHNLGSDPCSEPDGSTSDPLHLNHKNAATIASSPSNDPIFSADEDEQTSPLGHETSQRNYRNEQREQTSVGRQKCSPDELNKRSSNFSDSLILEAALRSELFARLGRRNLPKNSSSINLDPADEQGIDNDNGSEKTQASNCSVLLPEAERNQEFDLGSQDQPDKIISGVPVDIQNEKKNDDEYFDVCHPSSTITFSTTSILRSAFGHIKDMCAFSLMGLQSQKGEQCKTYDCDNGAGCTDPNIILSSLIIANQMGDSTGDICDKEIGSYNSNVVVDPFWPLCMYELRGKCNNDQCPWQHVRDFSNGIAGQSQHDNSDSSDRQVEKVHNKKCNSTTEPLNGQFVLAPPAYLVGLDILKSDPHSFDSVVARGNVQCWQKCFGVCIALSNLLQKDLPADEPILSGIDGRIEVQRSWDKELSYLRSRNSVLNHPSQALPSNLQSLEMAFLVLDQEVDKLTGMRKALSVLSRAIETDPHSEILWITYLLVYYGNLKSVAKDDMFSYAVKHNDRCYVLWIMYINSRTHLDDSLVAYDAALTALCRQSSAIERDEIFSSACVLDVFLQMMNILCMSGNVEKAIQKIFGIFTPATDSDQRPSLLLSDILACLTVSDKCIFWVCCIYLVMYRKLPEAVVHKFEYNKEFLAFEWPCVHLLDEEKQKTIKLVELAVDSVKFYINSESQLSEANYRSVQYFGLCHIRCVAALNGLECGWSLLDEYMKVYPASLEFVLISARYRISNFEGFEEALRKWPKETPGIQCIWNQYIECALKKRGSDFAKELVVRWYNSFSSSQEENLDDTGINSLQLSSELSSTPNISILTTGSNHLDQMFGYLNLSIARLLQHDQVEAHEAINRALKVSGPPFFEHCLREHALFLLMLESQLKEANFSSKHANILNSYLDNARAFSISEPLSRQFLNKIERPRVKQLISNILGPVTSDMSIVNLVLEVWYGPTLLPQKFTRPKELVDFVECILGIVPSNYNLAFSVCKLLSSGESFIDVSSSVLFWASSTLVNAIFHAMPVAPEYVWVDAAGVLDGISGTESICQRFYRKALSVYPFSTKLWNHYHNLCETRGDGGSVVRAARDKGIQLVEILPTTA